MLVTRGDQEVVNSVATNSGARFSDFGFLHMIQRAEGDSILAEQLGLREDIPRHIFQQLIAKASDDVRKRLEQERPAMVDQIKSTMSDVAGELQSKFGPVSRSYFVAKRLVTAQHRQGNLNENSISLYARSHKLDEVTIGLSLLCSLPGDVIERAMLDKNRETLLILAKALDFSWATTMALLFLGAKDHRITAQELRELEGEFGRLNLKTSRSVLEFYQSRKNAGDGDAGPKRQPAVAVNDAIDRTGWGVSAMNALSFGTASRERLGVASGEPKPGRVLGDMAWLVLEAANDLGDHAAVEACRRVIDANLNGRLAPQSDVHLVVDYFR